MALIANTDRWVRSYLDPDVEDPHQDFADRMGISRLEAKVLCYKMLFKFPFISSMLMGLKP